MNTANRILTLFFLISMGLIAFQNCSNVEFSSNDPSAAEKGGGELTVGEPEPPVPVVDPPPGEEEDDDKDCDHNARFYCNADEIKDIRVNVLRAEINGVEVTTLKGVRSLMQMSQGFNIIATQTTTAHQLRLVLAGENNQIVDITNDIFSLKTPSAQQSGLKINLGSGGFTFEANKAYKIQFELDPDFQVVRAGKKCLLKPVLRATSITEVET